jgi:hypothetical protein
MAAAAALAIFELAFAIAGMSAAWATWAAVCLSVPWLPHAWLIFPEMPAALVVAGAAWWLWAPLSVRPGVWIWRGAAIALLPWLHTKFIVLLAFLTSYLALRLWRQGRGRTAIAALGLPIAVSLALWVFSFYRMYGVLDPQAPYGSFTQLQVRMANIPRGVLGLLFDQKFGLLIYAPVYALAAAGCFWMLRDRATRVFALQLLALAAVFVASTTRFYMWWGGSSAPARFLVPALPLFAPMIAVAFDRARGFAGRSVFWTACGIGVFIAAAGLAEPRRLFSDPHGYSFLLGLLQNGAPLVESLPTFTNEDWRTPSGELALWIPAALAGVAAMVVAGRRRIDLGSTGLAAIAVSTFVVVASLLAGGRLVDDRAAVAQRGAAQLAGAYDGDRLWAIDWRGPSRLSEAVQRELATIAALRTPPADGRPRAGDATLGPFQLPPGRYSTRVWFDGRRSSNGEAIVLAGPRVPIARTPLAENPTPFEFDLPVTTAVRVGVAGDDAAAHLQRVDVAPIAIVPRHLRPRVKPQDIGPVEGHPGAFAVYVDEHARPEGPFFWTLGTRRTTVVVAPAGGQHLRLTLHVGANAGQVGLTVDGRDHSLALAADETRQVEVPVEGRSLVHISVGASSSFRPADVDPKSSDTRWLGCQVRLEVR